MIAQAGRKGAVTVATNMAGAEPNHVGGNPGSSSTPSLTSGACPRSRRRR